MQHPVEAAVEHLVRVVYPAADELRARREGHLGAGGQVVEDHHLVPVGEQSPADHAADVPGAAGDQKLHVRTSRSIRAACSGGMSLTKNPIADSEPARYFSLPGARRMLVTCRCR